MIVYPSVFNGGKGEEPFHNFQKADCDAGLFPNCRDCVITLPIHEHR